MSLQRVPKEIIYAICNLPEEYRHKILKVALASLQPKLPSRSKIIEKISHDCHISEQKTNEILAVYFAIIRLFLETSDKEFNSRLREIGFSSEFTDSLPLVSNRIEIVDTISNLKRSDYGKLMSLKWRADISLSDSSLQKKVPVSVILNLTLKCGKTYIIEVDGRTFHKLRYNIALLLRQFYNVKSNSVTTNK